MASSTLETGRHARREARDREAQGTPAQTADQHDIQEPKLGIHEEGPRAIAELLEIVTTSGYQAEMEGLGLIQWRALRYFANANPSACTVNSFARHNATTKGSASKTVSHLVRKGLLDRIANSDDGRSHRLSLTPLGKSILKRDPLEPLTNAVAKLGEIERRSIAEALSFILRDMAAITAPK